MSRGRRGVALLMVLTTLTLLYVLAQQLREESVIHADAAAAAREEIQAYYQAKSGVNLSRVLLHAEPTIRRAITPILAPIMLLMGGGLAVPQIPIWEQSELLLGVFRNNPGNSAFATMGGMDFSSSKNLGALTGLQPLRIVDEDAKINLNGFDRGAFVGRRAGAAMIGLLANPALEPFFTQRDSDGQLTDRLALTAAIIDWADADTNQFDISQLMPGTAVASGVGAPEDSIYSSFHPPYQRKNAPFDSVEELRMVRGLGDDDLWASVIDPNPGDPGRRNVTVWGTGAVNVNTVNAQTMLALLCAYAPASPPTLQCSDPLAIRAFVMAVSMVQAFTLGMGIPLFASPRAFLDTMQGRAPFGPMLQMLGVAPFVFPAGSQIEQVVTTESKVFSIYSEAVTGRAHVRIHAVVDMRAQPGIPGTYLRATEGFREAATTQAVTTNPTSGTTSTVSAAGGTIVYWRED